MRINDVQLEWRIAAVEREARDGQLQCDQNLYSMRSDVGSMEHTMRELDSLVNELRYELETVREYNRTITERLELLENNDEI